MTTLKLTIAIPTYNRVDLLLSNLLMLVKDIEALAGFVNIVVSDNASTDSTEDMVIDLINAYPVISYYRNEINVGMDRNANLAIQRSCGEFVLLLSDDDMLECGAVNEILSCISKHPDVGIIYSNFRSFNASLKEEITLRDTAFDPISQNMYFSDGLQVLKMTEKIFAAISGGIYRRQLWVDAHPDRFFDSIFIHVGITLDILCRERSPAFIFKNPLFKYRLNNNGAGDIKSFEDIFAVSFGLLRILVAHKRYLPEGLFKKMYLKELRWTRQKVVGAKARESVPIMKTFIKMKSSYDTTRLDFWLVDFPILLIPRWLLNVPYRLYRIVKYR